MENAAAFEAYRARPDRDSLGALLGACQDTVYTLCYHVLRRPSDAEDAAQKVLIQAATAAGRISTPLHFKRWLHQASFHVALNLKKEIRTRAAQEMKSARAAAASAPEDA